MRSSVKQVPDESIRLLLLAPSIFFPYIGRLLEQCPMVIHAHLDPSMLTWIHGSVTELDRHIRLLCNKNIARIQYKPTQVQQTTSDNGRGDKFHVCFS